MLILLFKLRKNHLNEVLSVMGYVIFLCIMQFKGKSCHIFEN